MDYYGVPLRSGGVLDQSVRKTNEIRAAKNVYNAFADMTAQDKLADENGSWAGRNPGKARIVASVQKLRMERKKRNG